MAWIAPTSSNQSSRHERNNMIGIVYSASASLHQELHRTGNRKPSHHFTVKDEFEEDDLRDELCNTTEKKRRLTADQVKFLEMSFSVDLKLEPERKALLAKQLGIRPRQVAIWFQNRRARWKNKQLEQDFENLKAKFETLLKEKEKILLEHGLVLEDNKRLQAEVLCLQDLLARRRNSVFSDTAGTRSDGKSELTSPTKSSVDQCDIQDSGQSYPLVGAKGMETIVPTDWELNPVNMRTDIEHAPIFVGDEFFGLPHPTVLVHCVAPSGVYLENGVYSDYGGGQFNGLTSHYDSASY